MFVGEGGCRSAKSRKSERAAEEQAGSDEMGGGPSVSIKWSNAV